MAENSSKTASTLVRATHKLLEDSTESLFDVSKKTDLPYYWLKSFKESPAPNASATRVQRLHEYLTGKPLRV